MRFAAFEEHSADVHGNYEHWHLPCERGSESEPDAAYDPYDDLMQAAPEDGNLFMVKIPKHLMERWSAVEEADVLLATIRVYPARGGAASKTRIVLTLPLEDDEDGLGPDEYEMDMGVAEDAMPLNEYVVAEYDTHDAAPSPGQSHAGVPHTTQRTSPKPLKRGSTGTGTAAAAPARRRPRRIALAGTVMHHCSLRAVLSERMRQRVRARSVAANTPKRQIIYLGSGVWPVPGRGYGGGGGRGGGGGDGGNRPFLMPTGGKRKAAADRMTRVARHTLLDMLFRLFGERARWSLRLLRERTQQPETYLKEVLADIAFLHRTGEHHGTWELSASYSGKRRDVDAVDPSVASSPNETVEDGETFDDDSDLEEVF
ncbi:transcription initiation factor IIF, beta subunit-domain-containing protein [Trametes gibbosa]|nr:transcription initiation factor IIF, beta subunit-domain-containing protein [Trametes gibbosa]